MGDIIKFEPKPKEDTKEDTTKEDRIARIDASLNRINSLMEQLKKNVQNEERLAKERKENNKNVLDNYNIRRKTR